MKYIIIMSPLLIKKTNDSGFSDNQDYDDNVVVARVPFKGSLDYNITKAITQLKKQGIEPLQEDFFERLKSNKIVKLSNKFILTLKTL